MAKSSSRSLAVVVLAAGEGKRLKSKKPKVLHDVCGRPSLWHVLKAAARLRPAKLLVVVSHDKGEVEEAVRSWGIKPEPGFVDQGKPLGTGHAVMAAETAVGSAEDVVVLPGDEPLHTGDQLAELLRRHRRSKAAATLIITELPDAAGYGRVVRDGAEFVRIAEEKEASAAERRIREVATCVYAFRRPALYAALPLIGTDNKQKEYYLPDVLRILKEKGEPIGVVEVDDHGGLGINTRGELAKVTGVMRERINAAHMAAGVTMTDPAQTFIDVEVKIGDDTLIHPLTFIEGTTRIGDGCEIGPSTRLVDTKVGAGSTVQFSVVRESRIGKRVEVGPFASIRPGTVLEDGSKAGTFVEIKKSTVGPDSKVPHLSYVGDAKLGRNVNLGAGTVTCNYDGWDKNETVIGDDALIGSDTMLVAPVRVGKAGVTAAGSSITKDVPAGALGVERGEQRNVKGYRQRRDAEKKSKGKRAKKE
ncbi:MAG: bifunctional UDP-N-acetylglucosamine diphosphorylase/glucosamine-1-phosphate N-acetyltransferase GlmU [Actinomycetota bacterium]